MAQAIRRARRGLRRGLDRHPRLARLAAVFGPTPPQTGRPNGFLLIVPPDRRAHSEIIRMDSNMAAVFQLSDLASSASLSIVAIARAKAPSGTRPAAKLSAA